MAGDRPPLPHDMIRMLLDNAEELASGPLEQGHWIADGLGHAGSVAVLGGSAEDMVRWIRITRDVGVKHFAAPASGAYLDVLSWMRTWYAAVILRDAEALALLRRVSPEVLAMADVKPDEVDRLVVDFLKAIHEPGADLGERLLAAMEADISGLSRARRGWLLEIEFPSLSVYGAMFGDRSSLGDKLESALEAHHHYWTAKDRRFDKAGWIAWPLVAACVVAWGSLDIPVDVDSDYLPLALVRGEW